ncbi:MAG: tetratricopeptide repeat protein [Brevinematales bacterium]|nr:tetratricopeptide repeat protein [Brevinematales bacterium]
MKRLCFLFIFFYNFLFSSTTMDFITNELAALRNTKEGIIKLLMILSNDYKTNSNSYDLNWQLSAMTYFYGDYYVNDNETKKKVFETAMNFGKRAVELNPKGPDGHYWLGIAYAKWSEANGILSSLFYADDVLDEMTKTIEIQSDFLWGLALAVRSRVYSVAPPWPISVGDRKKAYIDIHQALKYGPRYRLNHKFYAEILIDDGRINEAEKVIENALAFPVDKRIPLEEEKTIKELNDLKKRIKR